MTAPTGHVTVVVVKAPDPELPAVEYRDGDRVTDGLAGREAEAERLDDLLRDALTVGDTAPPSGALGARELEGLADGDVGRDVAADEWAAELVRDASCMIEEFIRIGRRPFERQNTGCERCARGACHRGDVRHGACDGFVSDVSGGGAANKVDTFYELIGLEQGARRCTHDGAVITRAEQYLRELFGESFRSFEDVLKKVRFAHGEG